MVKTSTNNLSTQPDIEGKFLWWQMGGTHCIDVYASHTIASVHPLLSTSNLALVVCAVDKISYATFPSLKKSFYYIVMFTILYFR